MNPYDNPIITYVKAASEYSSECELESKKLSELSQQEESNLLDYILRRNNPLVNKRLEYNGFLHLEAIKEKKGLKFTNKDSFFFYRNMGMEKVDQNKTLDSYTLDKIEGCGCFIQVEIPDSIRIQLDARKKQKEQKKKLTEEQKLARKLKKAEKLLKEAGKL